MIRKSSSLRSLVRRVSKKRGCHGHHPSQNDAVYVIFFATWADKFILWQTWTALGRGLATRFFTTLGAVLDEIESWRPHDCFRELDYRDSLHQKLQKVFRKPPVKEYGHGQSRADIAFGTSIAIELKLNLNTTVKLDRLVGQLMN